MVTLLRIPSPDSVSTSLQISHSSYSIFSTTVAKSKCSWALSEMSYDFEKYERVGVPNRILRDIGTEHFKMNKTGTVSAKSEPIWSLGTPVDHVHMCVNSHAYFYVSFYAWKLLYPHPITKTHCLYGIQMFNAMFTGLPLQEGAPRLVNQVTVFTI
jgi:hypothetical protein